MESNRVPLPEAAEMLGVPPQFLRWALQQGRFGEIGIAVKHKRWAYYINRTRLDTYLKKGG